MKSSYDAVIIGGGVIGCSIARELSRFQLDIALFESGPDVASGTSRANSGVIHAGYANRPGSLKAKLCVRGNKMFDEFTRQLGIPFKRVGKLVVGNGDDGRAGLERLYDQGQVNGVPGLSLIPGEEVSRLEPNITADHGMLSESSGITDPVALTIALANNACRNGVEFFLESAFMGAETNGAGFDITTGKGTVKSTTIINCAGLNSDVVAGRSGDDRYRIYPCRGEYFVLDKSYSHLLTRMVYPVPPTDYRVLGVHLTPTMDGNILLGPSAEFIESKLDLATTSDKMKILLDEAKDLLPGIPVSAVIQSFSGNRPKINEPTCGEVGDFIIQESIKVPGLINLIGIESPGLTCTPSIPPMVVGIIRRSMELVEKDNWEPTNPSRPRFSDLGPKERAALIHKDPAHGEVVCRCEHATKREVLDALNNPLGARSLLSVKMRTRTSMGRCQGGFCTPRIVEIMQELGIPAEEIMLKGPESPMFARRDADE